MLDSSLNLTMGPFRAFVADQLPGAQRTDGYVTYMFFASVGAVVGSLLPWVFAHLGVSSETAPGAISAAVKCSFLVGALLLVSAVCASAFASREYSPEALDRFDASDAGAVAGGFAAPAVGKSPAGMRRHGVAWIAAGMLGLVATRLANARPALYVLVGAALLYGAFLLVASRMRTRNAFTTILDEMESMSVSMRWLALVQFCSWFTLFAIFVYTAPAVAKLHFGATAPGTPAFEAGANWAGVLFATYNGLAALAALAIPAFVRRLGSRRAHQ